MREAGENHAKKQTKNDSQARWKERRWGGREEGEGGGQG
jgi:hypothetical protein